MPAVRVTTYPQAFERLRSVTDVLKITPGDLAGPVLLRMDAVHRQQEAEVFSTEGAAGAAGKWPALSAAYAAAKRRAGGLGAAQVRGKKGKARVTALRGLRAPISQKILVWSGQTRDRFTQATAPGHIARLLQRGVSTFVYQFGAASDIAFYHRFGTRRLPVRDMITKTPAQVQALLQVIVNWYRIERLPQAMRAINAVGGSSGGGLSAVGGAPGRAANPTS
jgi:hypothetical protein